MNIEHKPGVLCVIIGGNTPRGRSRCGQVVELVKLMYPGDTYRTGEVTGLQFNDTTPGWLVKGSFEDRPELYENNKPFAFYSQEYLLPIKDPDQDFVEDRKYKVVVTVNGVPVESYAPDEDNRLCI